MKTYVNQIIQRIEAILDTAVIDTIPPRVFTPGEMVGLVSITLSQDEGKTLTAVPARQIEDFLADPKAHTPPGAHVGLACMFIRVCESDDDYVLGQAAVATKILRDIPASSQEKMVVAIPPRFKTELAKEDITWNYCDMHNFIWRDIEGNDKGRFPHSTSEPLYIDVEFILMLIIGNNFLFPKLANVIVNYFTYYLDDPTEIETWGEATFNRLVSLHHRANLYAKETTLNTTIH